MTMQRGALVSVVSQLIWIVLSTGWSSASVCDETYQLTATFGVHSLFFYFPYSPTGYSIEFNCSWNITSANDEIVRLSVNNLDLEGGDGCPNDSLSIYDADGPVDDQRLATLCGQDTTSMFHSTWRYMYVHLVISDDRYNRRLELVCTALPRGTTPPPTALTTKEHQYVKAQLHRFFTLKSPNYPAFYSSHESMLWNIECDAGYVVRLHVVEMDLENSSPCRENRVTVYDSDQATVLAIMCNYQSEGVDLYSTGGGLYVHFTSGLASTGKGFSMAYQAVRPYEAKPWTTRGLRSTTSTTRPSSPRKRGLNTVTITAMMVGLGMMWVVICTACMCCRRRTQLPRPHVGRPAASTLRSAAGSSTTHPSNMTIHIASRPSTTPRPTVRFTPPADPPRPSTIPQPPVTAHTNQAFSAYSEDPPPYSSLQLTHLPSQPVSAVSILQLAIEPRPPPYSESMTVTYPPSYKEVTDDAAGQ